MACKRCGRQTELDPAHGIPKHGWALKSGLFVTCSTSTDEEVEAYKKERIRVTGVDFEEVKAVAAPVDPLSYTGGA